MRSITSSRFWCKRVNLAAAIGASRGPLPRGKVVQAHTCDILAAFALSRRTIRYNGVEKHAAFGPKMVADDIRPEESGPQGGRTQRRAGLARPWRRLRPSSCHGDFQSLPQQSVVQDDTRVIRPSVGNTGGTDDSVVTIGPNRPTVGSRPWTSPAKERAVALTA